MRTATLVLAISALATAETTLTEADLAAIAAARPPSAISILRGTTPGDATKAPGGALLIDALSVPDELWTVIRSKKEDDVSWVCVSAGKAWFVTGREAGLEVRGPVEAPDSATAVAASLSFPGADQAAAASGRIDRAAVAVLAALLDAPNQVIDATALRARVEKLEPGAIGNLSGAITELEKHRWIERTRERPEPEWKLLSPAARCFVKPDEVIRVTRETPDGAVTKANFLTSEAGTVAHVGLEATGLLPPRAASAAQVLRRLSTGRAAPPAEMREGKDGPRAGDEIAAELAKNVFRLSKATSTRDTFGRGQTDTWRVDKLAEYVDTTGTGTIDWVRVDDFGTGTWTRSFVLVDGTWQPSNILDVFLEIEFKLPWDRSAYHPHNLEVRLNGKTIARMEEVIPEGWHRFPLRPQDVRTPQGAGSTNEVRLVSEHLRGGHYVVSTNFNLAFQLGTVRRYVIAATEADADKILRESGRFTSGGVDAALYANEWTASNLRPKEGEAIVLKGLLRNLGGNAIPGGKLVVMEGTVELASVALPPAGAADLAPCEITLKLPPGTHALLISAVVEGDPRAANNTVPIVVRCGGDDVKPTLAVTTPAEGASAPIGAFEVAGTASDNVSLKTLEVSVNGGLWVAAAPEASWKATVQLAKGTNRIRVRAVDSSENATEVIRTVTGQ